MIEAKIRPAAVSITRYDLDAALWSAAKRAGVDTRANSEISSVSGDGPFQVASSSGPCTAKAVVIAAGRWSQFTADRTVPPGPRWIGLKAHFREANPSLSSDLYFFEDGYCGVQPVSDHVVNACAMIRSDCATTLPEVFALHPKLSQTSRQVDASNAGGQHSAVDLSSAAAHAETTCCCWATPRRSSIPFVGDGISIALRSGRVAAECLQQYLSGDATLSSCVARYEREYSQQFRAASGCRGESAIPALAARCSSRAGIRAVAAAGCDAAGDS